MRFKNLSALANVFDKLPVNAPKANAGLKAPGITNIAL